MGENVGSHGMKAGLLLPCRAVCVRKVGVSILIPRGRS